MLWLGLPEVEVCSGFRRWTA